MQHSVVSKKRVVISVAILVFWGAIFGWLIKREYFPDTSAPLKHGYKKVLQDVSPKSPEQSEKFESMTIYYQGHRQIPIGKIDSILRANVDGTFNISNRIKITIEDRDRVKLEHLSKAFQMPEMKGKEIVAGIQSEATIGPDYQLKTLKFRFKSNLFNVACQGQVETGKLLLAIHHDGSPNGKPIQREVPFSPNTVVHSGFDPMQLPKKLKVGQEFNMRWFDVLSRQYRTATSKVVAEDEILWYGKRIPVHIVNTSSGAFRFTTWIDENGEVVQYQIFNFLFIRDPKRRSIEHKITEAEDEDNR